MNKRVYALSIGYAFLLLLLAGLDVAFGLTGSYLTPAAFVAEAMLVGAFGYGAKRGRRRSVLVVAIIALGPLLSAGLQLLATHGTGWGSAKIFLWLLAVLGGVSLSGTAISILRTSGNDAHVPLEGSSSAP